MAMQKARLVAAAVLLTGFTALVAFAPRSDPADDTAPAMTAEAAGQAQD